MAATPSVPHQVAPSNAPTRRRLWLLFLYGSVHSRPQVLVEVMPGQPSRHLPGVADNPLLRRALYLPCLRPELHGSGVIEPVEVRP